VPSGQSLDDHMPAAQYYANAAIQTAVGTPMHVREDVDYLITNLFRE
jgi:hypothetical protein